MPIDKDSIKLALTRVMHPNAGMDIVSAGAVSKIAYCDGYASIRIAAGGTHADQRSGLKQHVTAAVRLHAQQANEELKEVHLELTEDMPQIGAAANAKPSAEPRPTGTPNAAQQRAIDNSSGHRPIPLPPNQAQVQPLQGVKHTIAVGAGKGGVGKSTVALNLAVGLARKGHAVGLMDADIYGPSMPTMLGLSSLDVNVRGSTLEPFYSHGIKCMTIGKLVDPEKPLIWRGPMAHGAFKQLVEQTAWGELDYLIIDLPPGTGDVALTMAQLLKLTGAIVVCTPQKVAQDDAVRAARMFQQLNIDVLGVVENMSSFIGDDGKEYDLFGKGGAQMMAQRLGLPFLGALPVNMALRQNSDAGDPTSNFTEHSPRNAPLVRALETLVSNVESQVALASLRSGSQRPTLSIS
jgi:ATP-binding protein involved in chromosome partitioning